MVVGLALTLLAAACAKDEGKKLDNVVPPTFGGPTTAKPKPIYQPVYKQQDECPVKGVKGIKFVTVVCGTLTVPEDRENPKGNKVALQVVTLKSTSPTPKPDPIVYLEGGPGGSALAGLEVWTNPPSPLLAERDVILVDQRGTGYSDPRLGCDFEFATSTKSDQDVELMAKCYERLFAGEMDRSGREVDLLVAEVGRWIFAIGDIVRIIDIDSAKRVYDVDETGEGGEHHSIDIEAEI